MKDLIILSVIIIALVGALGALAIAARKIKNIFSLEGLVWIIK